MKTEKTKAIAKLNDLFRRDAENFGYMGRRLLTEGIYALPIMDQYDIMTKVERFRAFTPDNDPSGEHDFGAFSYQGRKIFWKIDYYNLDITGSSADPSDPEQTVRVLTTMLASEY